MGHTNVTEEVPMNARRLARGLGWFSIALGAAELIAPGRLSNRLGLDRHGGKVRAFGLREVLSGAAILANRGRAPEWLWARLLGDAMDMGLLQAARPVGAARRRSVDVARLAVLGAAALDLVAASKLTRRKASLSRRLRRHLPLADRRFA
jgi:hypothetical protein